MRIVPLTIEYDAPWFALYRAAFPKSERQSESVLRSLYASGKTSLRCLLGDGHFVGLLATAEENGLTFVDFLAIEPTCRGGGLGSAALACLRRETARIVLEIESPDVPCDNAEQRARRKAFYLANGFCDSGLRVDVYGTTMELLHVGGVRFAEYARLFDRTHPDTPPAARPRLLDANAQAVLQ